MKKLFRIDDFGAGCFRIILVGVIVSTALLYYQFS
jgi:hypothetical protein